ncbi:hypothetical protein HUT16_23935 [Kitasatospora sp. NA04385]|uniref:hypothetical protein n=1 Tax=Kitasatospora sp. NA04385 TaxID=2742135 RepID=UPI0015921541|nr:hypothetical protein [Kitasatospora sp. NA04385]QKW21705.1 hypothetical protein HUT16_23935 [Kitasatospora sp. NA04385]
MSETTTGAARSTANPRRTTLASVADFPGSAGRTAPAYAAELPPVTANPRRTVLMTAPAPRLPRD